MCGKYRFYSSSLHFIDFSFISLLKKKLQLKDLNFQFNLKIAYLGYKALPKIDGKKILPRI